MTAPTVTAATMTAKGHITVPRDVREALGLTAGVSVVFVRSAMPTRTGANWLTRCSHT